MTTPPVEPQVANALVLDDRWIVWSHCFGKRGHVRLLWLVFSWGPLVDLHQPTEPVPDATDQD